MFYLQTKINCLNLTLKSLNVFLLDIQQLAKSNRTLIVEEIIHVAVDESNRFYPMQARNEKEVMLYLGKVVYYLVMKLLKKKQNCDESLQELSKDWKSLYDHLKEFG